MAKKVETAKKANDVIEVLSEDQIKKLPKEIQEGIVILDKNLPSEKMNKLNPVLVEFFKLKQKVDDIKYIEGDDKKNKESIALYKKIDKEFIAYKKALTETHKEIKKPLQEVIKPLDAFKRIFVEKQDEERSRLKGKFKPYLDEQAKKAQQRKEKAKAAETARIAELEAQNTESQNIIKRGQVYNRIKHTLIGGISKTAAVNVSQLSLEALINEKNQLSAHTYQILIQDEKDYDLLEDSQKTELQKEYDRTKETYLKLYGDKIETLEKQKDADYNARKLKEQEEKESAPAQEVNQTPQEQEPAPAPVQSNYQPQQNFQPNFQQPEPPKEKVYQNDKEFVSAYLEELIEVRQKFLNNNTYSIKQQYAVTVFSELMEMMFRVEQHSKDKIENINS